MRTRLAEIMITRFSAALFIHRLFLVRYQSVVACMAPRVTLDLSALASGLVVKNRPQARASVQIQCYTRSHTLTITCTCTLEFSSCGTESGIHVSAVIPLCMR